MMRLHGIMEIGRIQMIQNLILFMKSIIFLEQQL